MSVEILIAMSGKFPTGDTLDDNEPRCDRCTSMRSWFIFWMLAALAASTDGQTDYSRQLLAERGNIIGSGKTSRPRVQPPTNIIELIKASNEACLNKAVVMCNGVPVAKTNIVEI